MDMSVDRRLGARERASEGVAEPFGVEARVLGVEEREWGSWKTGGSRDSLAVWRRSLILGDSRAAAKDVVPTMPTSREDLVFRVLEVASDADRLWPLSSGWGWGLDREPVGGAEDGGCMYSRKFPAASGGATKARPSRRVSKPRRDLIALGEVGESDSRTVSI
jgi:hypothetical protein